MPIIFAFFIIFIIPILVLSWLAWEWDFLGQRNFLVSEKFVIEGSVYQKLNELSFVSNVQNQAVFMEVVSPNQHTVEFPITKRITDVFDFAKNWIYFKTNMGEGYLFERMQQSEIDKQRRSHIWPNLLKDNQTLLALNDCVVKDNANWICNTDLNFLKGRTSYIGLRDGGWQTDHTPYSSPMFKYGIHGLKNGIYKWKTEWFLEKLRCGNVCLVDSVENIKIQNQALDAFIEDLERTITE